MGRKTIVLSATGGNSKETLAYRVKVTELSAMGNDLPVGTEVSLKVRLRRGRYKLVPAVIETEIGDCADEAGDYVSVDVAAPANHLSEFYVKGSKKLDSAAWRARLDLRRGD